MDAHVATESREQVARGFLIGRPGPDRASRLDAPGQAFAPAVGGAAAIPAKSLPAAVAHAWRRLLRALATTAGQRRLAWALTVCLVVLDLLVVGHQVLVRHFAYHSDAFDLGNMDQAVWNTLHGHFFRFTNRGVDWYGPPTRLAIHVEPILLLIAPLYLIHSGAATLLALQTTALALGAIPLLALWLRRLPDLPLLGVCLVVGYLVSPELLGEALYDFHPVALATPLLLAAFYALEVRRYRWFVVAAVLAASCKEDVALALVPLGLLIALRRGRPALGLSVAAGAIAWTSLCFLVIMPHFDGGASQGGNAYWYRYSALGESPTGALRHVLVDPLALAQDVFSPDKLGYLALLGRTGGALGIFAPFWWLAATPELAVNLLSDQQAQYSGFYHYNAMLLPTLLVAAIYGTDALRRARLAAVAGRAETPAGEATGALAGRIERLRLRWMRLIGRLPVAPRLIAPLVLAWLLVCAGWNLATIQPKLHGFWDAGDGPAPHQAQIDALLARIPAGATVAATDTLDPHLTDRETIYLMPDPDAYGAEYVAVEVPPVVADWQEADIVMFSSMATSGRYRVVGVAGAVVVLQRTGPPLA
jgi:uncharacterized membrane protein